MDERPHPLVAGVLVLAVALAGAAAGPARGEQAPGAVPAEGGSAPASTAQAQLSGSATARVRDLTRIEGLRANQIVGLGLVVGLGGTGDSRTSPAHIQMVSNMLRNFGVTVDTTSLRPRNVAAVMVTALLPPLARPGDRIDVTVSSLGDARSLAGGVLLQTPLQGADSEVYAVAQGSLLLGGGASRRSGQEPVHLTVAGIPSGAIVERTVESPIVQEQSIRLVLRDPDFVTASRIVAAVNAEIGQDAATTADGAVIAVRLTGPYQKDPAGLLGRIQDLVVTPAVPGRVVVSERTGTVVLGAQARISPVAVSHNGISVRVGDPAGVTSSEGAAADRAASGAWPVVPAAQGVWPQEATGHTTMLQATATVGELVDALNRAGVGPRDVIAILQAVRAAGALFAELEVI